MAADPACRQGPGSLDFEQCALKWASGYKTGKISPVPDCPRSGRARVDSASAFGAVYLIAEGCRVQIVENAPFVTFCTVTFCPRSTGHLVGACGRIERFARSEDEHKLHRTASD
jgi:hypothetical protein